MRYPNAEWVPWEYQSSQGPTYFRGINKPIAVVLHIAQGYASTARAWAAQGHYGASWHYTVSKDGTVMQHLDHIDGGYHAGISSPPAPTPTWSLWKGSALNINCYTIGIEHEGFSGEGFTDAQRVASRDLCRWLATELGFPYDRDHFPPHADIDLINRPGDFGPPEYREQHYAFMFEEDEVSQKDFEDLVLATFSGSEDRDTNGKTLPREERLPIALDRMRNRADGGFGSVADRAESAYVIAQQGGGTGKHTHEVASAIVGDPK